MAVVLILRLVIKSSCPAATVISKSFSTTSVQNVSKRKQLSRLKKKKNLSLKQSRIDKENENLPSPALGHSLDQSFVWDNCELNKILLTPSKVYSNEGGISSRTSLSNIVNVSEEEKNDAFPGIEVPKLLNAPLKEADLLSIFKTLPSLSIQRDLASFNLKSDHELEAIVNNEKGKLETFSRVIDLRNASSKGIMLENMRRCIATFGNDHINQNSTLPSHQGDTGKPEVQAAILTTRIRLLIDHLRNNSRDTQNKRSLTMLVHQRSKILKYLKKLSETRYYSILPRLGLTPKAIEMEVSGKLI